MFHHSLNATVSACCLNKLPVDCTYEVPSCSTQTLCNLIAQLTIASVRSMWYSNGFQSIPHLEQAHQTLAQREFGDLNDRNWTRLHRFHSHIANVIWTIELVILALVHMLHHPQSSILEQYYRFSVAWLGMSCRTPQHHAYFLYICMKFIEILCYCPRLLAPVKHTYLSDSRNFEVQTRLAVFLSLSLCHLMPYTAKQSHDAP